MNAVAIGTVDRNLLINAAKLRRLVGQSHLACPQQRLPVFSPVADRHDAVQGQLLKFVRTIGRLGESNSCRNLANNCLASRASQADPGYTGRRDLLGKEREHEPRCVRRCRALLVDG
jgi:hypothetical protein